MSWAPTTSGCWGRLVGQNVPGLCKLVLKMPLHPQQEFPTLQRTIWYLRQANMLVLFNGRQFFSRPQRPSVMRSVWFFLSTGGQTINTFADNVCVLPCYFFQNLSIMATVATREKTPWKKPCRGSDVGPWRGTERSGRLWHAEVSPSFLSRFTICPLLAAVMLSFSSSFPFCC